MTRLLRGRDGSRFAGRRFSLARASLSVLAVGVAVAGVAASTVLPLLPTPVSGAPLADRWFGAYYDVTLEEGADLARSSLGVSPGGTVLAFVVAASDDACTPTWGRAYSLDEASTRFDLDRRVERLQREGRPVAVSFGGAINTELALACRNVAALTDAYNLVIDRYGVDTIDLDIEGDAFLDDAATVRRAAAIARLQHERDDPLHVWLTLPVAPTGLTADGIGVIDAMLDAGVELAGVNVMTMNYGIAEPASLAGVSAEALTATSTQLATMWEKHHIALPTGGAWALLGATPMIGRNDVPTEVFSLDDARELNAFAAEKGLARMSMWSLNRDHTCGSNYPYTDVVSPACSGVEQAGERFVDLLAADFDGGTSAPDPGEPIPDDPDTSPYPVWQSTTYYSAGVKVVWNGGVYVSKWWTEDGPTPDDPTLDLAASAWTYVGPVLAEDEPFALPVVAAGTYPEWDATTLYDQGDRVVQDGVGYEARWWSRGQDPARSILDRDYSPWKLLEE
ncbi:chitinase [Microbacterium dauci]|uniref:Chitinase n=1 Tax=Microbacterium dauci TaxID=3048008 RepID=A0ABT6ZEE0_9MICO|nr:chitinase [Microbacterium sp. LX3-4]MDJ1114536.1 chitinase [Microbacterium sp. LX3-4]